MARNAADTTRADRLRFARIVASVIETRVSLQLLPGTLKEGAPVATRTAGALLATSVSA
jgi:hypothetical protein